MIKSRTDSPDKTQHKAWLRGRKIGTMISTWVLQKTSPSASEPNLWRDQQTKLIQFIVINERVREPRDKGILNITKCQRKTRKMVTVGNVSVRATVCVNVSHIKE